MTTADNLVERALTLAQGGADTETAVADLLEEVQDRRVAVVMARRYLEERLADGSDETTTRAIGLLEEVLERLPAA